MSRVEHENLSAETFLKSCDGIKLLNDAVVTRSEFREFCTAFDISPSVYLKLAEGNADDRVSKALEIWFHGRPSVTDLKEALKQWGQFALIEKMGLHNPSLNYRPIISSIIPPPPPTKTVAKKVSVEEKADDSTCVVCFEKQREIAFVPCGHRCCCSDCSKMVLENCPLCRAKFTSKIKVFG